MDEMTPRKRHAREMRATIQNTALELFQQKGFENVSMQEIAQTVGCSIGNLYHYFKSKDELAIQVTANVDSAYGDWEADHPLKPGKARERLLDFVSDSLLISSHEEVLYTSFIHAMKYPEQGILSMREDRTWFRLLTEMIEDCKAENEIRPDIPTADILRDLVSIHRGLLFQWRVEEEAFDLADTGRRIAVFLLSGMKH